MANPCSRRDFLKTSAATAVAPTLAQAAFARAPLGERPQQSEEVTILNPRGRVPVSFIIDDSTCLVNMGHFCMPQFAASYPQRQDYQKPWQQWPREIPDSFVRKFGQWCHDHGVKGKYSVVPCPAAVGWVDRFLPGWSHQALQDSIKLVKELMVPDWDIHPEMITHTRMIDLKTGRPYPKSGPDFMENSGFRGGGSVDEIAAYIAYALRILKNIELPCEGFTTPGGFGNGAKSELALGGKQALQEVYNVEVPHYFKYLETGPGSTQPRVEHVSGLASGKPEYIVNVLGSTGDWFGGWDGSKTGSVDKFISEDLESGRMVECIQKQEPAIMLCHWPGIYCNGSEHGFEIFQAAVGRLHGKYYDQILWMKLSEIARYWAAKELTTIERSENQITLQAPVAAPNFTLQFSGKLPIFFADEKRTKLRPVKKLAELHAGNALQQGEQWIVCFDLPHGTSRLSW